MRYYEFDDCITEVSAPIVKETREIIVDIIDGGFFGSDTLTYEKRFLLTMSGHIHSFSSEAERDAHYDNVKEILFEEPKE